MMITTAIALACLAPLKPLPPLGCSSDNAVLITNQDGHCYWVFVGC